MILQCIGNHVGRTIKQQILDKRVNQQNGNLLPTSFNLTAAPVSLAYGRDVSGVLMADEFIIRVGWFHTVLVYGSLSSINWQINFSVLVTFNPFTFRHCCIK